MTGDGIQKHRVVAAEHPRGHECSSGTSQDCDYVCDVRWALKFYWGGHFVGYIDVKSLCCTPAANLVLYVSYN